MKKIALYTFGGLVLAGLAGFWVYSFLYGSPTNNAPTFANFDFFGGAEVVAEPLPVFTPTEPIVDVVSDKLRQLTMRPVIGMRVIEIDSTRVMRYVEVGTGHVFDIDLATGKEERVSGISIPNANKAQISLDGTYIGILAYEARRQNLSIINLEQIDTPTKIDIPNSVQDFTFDNKTGVLFTEIESTETVAKRYDINAKSVIELFRLPFTQAKVLWGTGSSSHYVQVKPAPALQSALYKIKGKTVVRTPVDGTGLTALVAGDTVFFSVYLDSDNLQTYKWENGEVQEITFSAIMDKCVISSDKTLYCGTQIGNSQDNLPAAWYTGERTFSDALWSYTDREMSSQLVNPQLLLGRAIDISMPAVSPDNSMVYFINKIDQTLWLYEL